MAILNPAGGLVYHLRALKSADQWRSYRAHVHRFLLSWNPPNSQILLVGPSAGYSLSRGWLQSFTQVIGLEVDPSARLMFDRRHKLRTKWIKTARFEPDLDSFRTVLEEYPDAAVLFCNFLGQLPALYPATDLDALHRELRQLLSNRNWASYHDRVSGQFQVGEREQFYFASPTCETLADDWKLSGELMDHETSVLSEGLPCRVFPWRLTESSTHLIEAIQQAA
ncbi:MAG: hypothetical protein JNJ45_04190 [Chthonomonas sp.]|nr:hypothetical protein [Chthonomonas sp.]